MHSYSAMHHRYILKLLVRIRPAPPFFTGINNNRVKIAVLQFCNLFALSADVLYSRQGTKGEGVKVKTDNLNIPILANFYLVKGLAVKAGIQPGFLLKAKNNDVDVKAAYKKADVAVPVGVSYLFNCGLILDARYNIGLTSLAKDKDIVTRNSVFAVTAGWRF